MNHLKKISTDQYLLLFIMAVAATIRFWDFSSMQFMHDELSALLRSGAGSFSEVIYKTATTDVHPVGVPVFVHYWTKIFGTGEMIVKLPFILFGLASIYYSYKIAEKWFNPTVALFTCACLATLQFPTMYGQLERPYASGMLFSVLMVWCWTQFFFTLPDTQVSEKGKGKYIIGFAFFASLCTYNHYFSLLFAALVGATGLFFLNKQNAKMYLSACAVVIILFIPHINILLYHLTIGSGGEETWIGKPQPDWLLTFMKYLFHYSGLVYSLIGLVFLAGFYFRNKEKKPHDKMRIIALIWGILVPSLAYFYSISKTPVLQFSTFTFGLPFLLMFIFSFYGELKAAIKTGIIAAIIFVNVFTLIVTRKHFTLFYQHPYEEMARISDKAIAAFGESRVSVAHFAIEGFVDFYFKKYERPFKYFRVDEKPDVLAFVNYLESEKTDYFVAGNLPMEYVQLVEARYPYLISKNQGFTFTIYCFSKTKPKEGVKERALFSENQNAVLASQKKVPHWEAVKNSSESEAYPGTKYMRIDDTLEYSPGFFSKIGEIAKAKNRIINVSAEIGVGKNLSNPTLVLTIEDKGTVIFWAGSELNDYRTPNSLFNTVYVSHLFSGTGIELEKLQKMRIKAFVWNRDKKETLVRNFKVEVIESNPMIYGLYEPID